MGANIGDEIMKMNFRNIDIFCKYPMAKIMLGFKQKKFDPLPTI